MTRTQLGEEDRSSPPPLAVPPRTEAPLPSAPHPAAEFLARPDFYSILHMNAVSILKTKLDSRDGTLHVLG